MEETLNLLVLTLDEQRVALSLSLVERVVRAVAVTPVRESPELVHGIINAQGRIIPVINLRHRLGFSPRPVDLDTKFIIARMAKRTVALAVDEVEGVIEAPARDATTGEDIFPGISLEGVLRLGDDMVLVEDLEALLSSDVQTIKSLVDKGETTP